MNARFLNIEYFFNKIYWFFVGLFDGVGGLNFSFIGSWLTTVAVIVFIGFFILLIYSKVRTFELDDQYDEKYKAYHSPQYKNPAAVNERWTRIEAMYESGNPNDWRIAILESDAMLDELIQSLGVPGENLGERLKALSPATFPAIQNAWEAHKVRNRIAHEGMNFGLSRMEVDNVRRNYEYIFIDAGII